MKRVSDMRRALCAGLEYIRQCMVPAHLGRYDNRGDCIPRITEEVAPLILGTRTPYLNKPLTKEETIRNSWLAAKLYETEGIPCVGAANHYADAALNLIDLMESERYGKLRIIASAKYVVEWMEKAIAIESEARYLGHGESKAMVDTWEEAKTKVPGLLSYYNFASLCF
jgi:hypothetical protein